MNPWVGTALVTPPVLAAGVALALLLRVRRAHRPARHRPYVPSRAQARWGDARRWEIDTESTIIIPAGDGADGVAQWDGMISRSFPDDPA